MILSNSAEAFLTVAMDEHTSFTESSTFCVRSILTPFATKYQEYPIRHDAICN